MKTETEYAVLLTSLREPPVMSQYLTKQGVYGEMARRMEQAALEIEELLKEVYRLDSEVDVLEYDKTFRGWAE